MHESEKWKRSHWVVSNSSRPHGLQPTRLFRHGIFQARVLEWGAIAFSIFWGPFKVEVAYRKEWNNAVCSNMDGPRDDYTKWSKSGKERQTSYNITFMWNLKYDTYELIYKTDTDSQTENKLMVSKGEVWSGEGWMRNFGLMYRRCVVRAQLLQLCPTHGGPVDCSLSGSSVHGILQARML